jgi:pectinesterase
MLERRIGNSAVAYGIERMNKEVSQWTRGLREDDDIHNFPSMPVPRK